MNRYLLLAGLGIRVFLAWWLGVTCLLGILGGLTGLGVGLLVFVWIAAFLGAAGAWLQHRGCPGGTRTFSAFPRAAIQVSADGATVEKAVAAILQEELAASRFSLRAHRAEALFQPPGWSGGLRRWARSDEIVVEVRGEEPGCTLEVVARPLSRFLYGVLWVDMGRNQDRLHRFQECLRERLGAEWKREAEARKADSLEARLAQAELLLLRAQVEPHFLFNTLAHLRELIRTGDGATALTLLDHLIAYCRSASDRIRRPTQTLGQELEGVRGYLSLLRIRFGDRLDFDLQAEPGTLGEEVPVGCLLIPVENAVKHGIEPRGTPGSVRVRCRFEAARLVLEVRDDGPGLGVDSGGRRGSGLSNLRERLELQHGGKARLVVADHEEGGVQVRVELPCASPGSPFLN